MSLFEGNHASLCARLQSVTSRVLYTLAIFVGAMAITTGCNNGSGDGAGWSLEGSDYVYRFQSIIRIGDDIDYNEHELDYFKINSAVSESFSATFTVPNFEFSQAVIYGQVAGSSQPDKLFLNGTLVGILPKGNNSAQTIKDFAFDATPYLEYGENNILITLEEWPGDTVSPLDDIEIYDLRLVLVP